MKYLVNVVETYRVENETEVATMIDEAKKDSHFTLVKHVSEKKTKKSKGEIIDEYYKVTLTKAFNDINLPDRYIKVDYEIDF